MAVALNYIQQIQPLSYENTKAEKLQANVVLRTLVWDTIMQPQVM